MPLWIPITIAAALFQNIRTTMQQKIRGVLSVDGANFVRYLYGAPLALSALAFLVWGTGRTVPTLTIGFLSWITVAGIAGSLWVQVRRQRTARGSYPFPARRG